ncbi:MAG: hypothetical protein E7018_06770 [Alphaproteobacteria bacterium]|nr:hypothetical protein [Alphaproteobacteria bacterium]
MVRVPTYASYINMMNQTLRNKSQFELYNYQSITGLKAPTYSGYGASAYSIVNFEATLDVTSTFLENNKLLNVELKAMNTSMQSINDTISDFKTMLSNFTGAEVERLTPDYTGGEITFTNNEPATYVGKTITVDGVQYTFTDGDATGNNIDLSGIAADAGTEGYAQKVMDALKNKVDPTGKYPEFEFDGATFKFPLYTINGGSTILSADGVETGEPYTMNQDQAHNLNELQNSAFTTLKMLADNLNIQANGKYLFGGGDATQSPINFPFKTLDEFQAYYDGVNIKFPTNSAANLCNRTLTSAQTGGLTIDLVEGNQFKITPDKEGGFLEEAVTANPNTTGKLTFNADKNTLNATQYGAFNTIKAGDTLIIGGTADNNKSLVVKSVSSDGKTIVFEESVPGIADEVLDDPTGVTLKTSFPTGAVIDLNNMGNNIAPRVQVLGVNVDGTLNVRADPDYFNADSVRIEDSSRWSMSTMTYYTGGDLNLERRISENQSVTMDVTANDGAFEKLFRSLGQIAQANVVDTRNPADIEGLIQPNRAYDIMITASKLIQSAVDDSGETTKHGANSSLYVVSAKLNANYVLLNNVDENLTLVKNNLQSSVDSLKNVDKTEAAVKALLAQNNLEASYSVLQNALSLSLLNYID